MDDILRQVLTELKGSWRFRWLSIALAWLICLAGWLFVYTLPDSFESEATVYVDTVSALDPLLDNMTIGNDVLSRVELVTTAMLGRPLLEQVARETDLHLRAATPEEMDRMITQMRQRISISNGGRREPNRYVISYQDPDPIAAQAVVSSMLNIFVEDSLGANRLDTQEAQVFLREELTKLSGDLEQLEQELADFKKRNVGRMPGEGGDYFARLQAGIDELEATQAEIRLAERRREALQQQLAGERPTLSATSGLQSDVDIRISENESRLEELRLRFTDKHPDVIAVNATLEQLRTQKQEQLDEVASGDVTGIASDNPVFQNIQIELTTVNVNIETLTEQLSAQQARIDNLRALIDVLPQVEVELTRLTRDYAVKQAQYESLLQRLEVAELSESADQSEDVQFRIIDPPILPITPVAPNRPLLLAGVLLVGLGGGAALAFLMNQISRVFMDATTLRQTTGLPVLGSVLVLNTVGRRRRRMGQLIAFASSVLLLCAASVIVILMHEPAVRFVQSLV